MNMRMFILTVIMAVMCGCASTRDGLSYNMTQSASRSAGDIAVTALLDEGKDAEKIKAYITSMVEFLESGETTLSKEALKSAAFKIATKVKLEDASDYIDALISVVPSKIKGGEKIPDEYKDALLSFLKDGALRAMELYDVSKKPVEKPKE